MDYKNKTRIQKEIVKNLPPNSHGILLLAPRVGKTKVAIDLIKKENPENILWVTPSTKLRDIDIPSEFTQWKAKRFFKRTNIICWGSLGKHKGVYDKIILDEYQYITLMNSKPLFNGKLKFDSIICLSGTHPKHVEKQELLTNLKLNILKEIGFTEAVEEGLIADYTVRVVEVDTDDSRKDVTGGSKKKPFMTTEKKNYAYLSKTLDWLINTGKNATPLVLKRLHSIYNSNTKEMVAKFLMETLEGRKMIFCGSIEQSKRLSPYTFNSKTDDKHLNLFMEEKIDELALVKSGGTGFTYRNVDKFIIVQSDSDKKGETTQKIARSLLAQVGYKAEVYVVCLTGTVDEKWVGSALENFEQSKIERIRYVTLKYEYDNK